MEPQQRSAEVPVVKRPQPGQGGADSDEAGVEVHRPDDGVLTRSRVTPMKLNLNIIFMCVIAFLATLSSVLAQPSEAPKNIKSENSLPDRYQYVAKDVLDFCQPQKGFWVDLGAGQGQVAIPLIEAASNPVVMLDPNAEAMTKGLEIAREKGLRDQLFAVVGVAEDMPFPDNSVDLVVSRGSIFFWDDPVKGLQEVCRVLRPGGKAVIGGGAGSGYPKEAAEKLIASRTEKLKGDEAEKWKQFVELRRPEKLRAWAEAAGLTDFDLAGKGAISADDPKVGQGVWLWFTKQEQAHHTTND
jgi:ubiquinone/menaquinone biosynthesis C-methylase UbiE